MSDTERLAEAMKELAAAIQVLADKLPASAFAGGFTVYHQHSHNQQATPNWNYGGTAGHWI